jgi:hypothetical protein
MNRLHLPKLVVLGLLALQQGVMAQENPLPPKPPGVLRIGLVQPRVQTGTAEAAQAADAIRNMLGEYLRGPTIEVALLSSRLPSQFEQEALQAECDYTLSASVMHRRGSDVGALGKALGNFGGYGNYIPAGDAVQSMIVSGVIQTAADFASTTKAKDVLQLEYQLQVPGAAKPLLKSVVKVRASTDGEDLLTPLVEKSAEAVGAAIARN